MTVNSRRLLTTLLLTAGALTLSAGCSLIASFDRDRIGTDGGADGDVRPMDAPMMVCGDGVVTGPEQCDDGNTDNDDGCSDVCMIESGYACDDSEPSNCLELCGQD